MIRILLLYFVYAVMLVFSSSGFGQTNQSGGTILFTDGTSQEFSSVISIHHEPSGTAGTLHPWQDGLHVYYKNTYRMIPYDKLSFFEVHPTSIKNGFVRGTVFVKTKTDITFSSPISIGEINISIIDELTGEMIDQGYNFSKGTSLIIKKVVFE